MSSTTTAPLSDVNLTTPSSKSSETTTSTAIPPTSLKTTSPNLSAALPVAAPASYSSHPRYKYKLVFLGDESTGKTSLITRFMYDTFDEAYKVTIGIDFVSKTLSIQDRMIRLQLWDTAGQERFRSLIPSYIRDSNAAIVVYDIANRASYINTEKWIEDVRKERGKDVKIMLVGNKIDLKDQRQVTFDEATSKARDLGVLFLEASAKANTNVKELFQSLAESLPTAEDKRPTSGKNASSTDVKLTPVENQSSSSCRC